MDTTLSASTRSGTNGKGAARKLRRDGKLLGVVYGQGGAATPIELSPGELVEIFKGTGGRNTVVQLEIDGAEPKPVLVRDVQRHPLGRELLHVDFYALEEDVPVRVMVPVTIKGKAAGAILGGRIRVIRRELPVRCTYSKIPERLTVDVSPLNIGDMVRASEITLAEGVSMALDKDINVITCYGRRVSAKEQK